jgi:hypothetical protein
MARPEFFSKPERNRARICAKIPFVPFQKVNLAELIYVEHALIAQLDGLSR